MAQSQNVFVGTAVNGAMLETIIAKVRKGWQNSF